MSRWSPAPPLTDESARLYYHCKSLYGRASAKLRQVESSKSREHSTGVSVETACWLAPKTNFRAAAPRAGVDIQLPPDAAPCQVSDAVIDEQAVMGAILASTLTL